MKLNAKTQIKKHKILRGETLTWCQGNIHGARDWSLYSMKIIFHDYNSSGIRQLYKSILYYITAASV